MKINIAELSNFAKNNSWQKTLKYISNKFSNVIFSTSFSIEDQIITECIATEKLNINMFTLDTGRLPSETYNLWQKTINTYDINIEPYYPNNQAIENFVKKFGINSFYDSKKLRHECCTIRKVEPLKRALLNQQIWISGVTKEQSEFRHDKPIFEYDTNFNLVKYYPLLDIGTEDIWQEINNKKIPYNSLYNSGYKSIGCQPCTRAVQNNENYRAGRWWWENDSKKECGLHFVEEKFTKANDQINEDSRVK